MENIQEKVGAKKHIFRKKSFSYILGALGVVAGFVWKMQLDQNYTYAAIITIITVIIILILLKIIPHRE